MFGSDEVASSLALSVEGTVAYHEFPSGHKNLCPLPMPSSAPAQCVSLCVEVLLKQLE